jgi:hypothetical protein
MSTKKPPSPNDDEILDASQDEQHDRCIEDYIHTHDEMLKDSEDFAGFEY